MSSKCSDSGMGLTRSSIRTSLFLVATIREFSSPFVDADTTNDLERLHLLICVGNHTPLLSKHEAAAGLYSCDKEHSWRGPCTTLEGPCTRGIKLSMMLRVMYICKT